MKSFFLIVWLVVPSNYADVDEFKTLKECEVKLQTYKKALQQAQSSLNAECVERINGD